MVQLCDGDDCWLWRYAGDDYAFGRIISIILAIYGILFLGSLSGLVVSYYTEVSKHYSLAIEQDKQKNWLLGTSFFLFLIRCTPAT